MRVVMFVGPSLPSPPDARGVDIVAPAGRGDVLAAARAGADVIGLVDGLLGTRLAVSNGEIRAAARAGARLFGAASIGALRAVECPDVMTGVGVVYESFRAGTLTDDDEVACTFTTPDYRMLSYPLVTIRAALSRSLERDPRLSHAPPEILRALKALPFHERTQARVRRATMAVLDAAAAESVGAALGDPRDDPKRADALSLLQVIRPHVGC